MVVTLANLGKWLDKIATNVDKGAESVRREVVIGIVNRVAELTPVDTGQARSNWIVSLDTPASGVRKPFSPIPSRWRKPYPRGGNRSERRNLLGVTMTAQGVMKGYKDGQAVYITNNLPYIERLDSGYSPQSPAGFVRRGFKSGILLGMKNARFKL